MNVKGELEIVGKAPYIGQGKQGKYASFKGIVKNPRGYGHWREFYAPNGSPFLDAQVGDKFLIEGYLDESTFMKDGEKQRKPQVVITSVSQPNHHGVSRTSAVTSQYEDQGISDSDIPF